MEIIMKTDLQEANEQIDKSLILGKVKNGYVITCYSYSEGRNYPVADSYDENEAMTIYKNEIYRHRTKQAILNVAKRRIGSGATREDIQRYRDQLLQTWKDPDIRQFLYYLENMVFA